MPKSSLLFLSHTHQFLGGGEHSLLAIMKDCQRNGYAVHVIVSKKGEFLKQAKAAGIETHLIKSYWWTKNGNNEHHPTKNKQAVAAMRQLISKIRPTTCLTNTITNPWLAYAAALEGVNHNWIIREYGDSDHGLTFWADKLKICQMVSDLSDMVFVNSQALKTHYQRLMPGQNIDIIYPKIKPPKATSRPDCFRPNAIKLVCPGSIQAGKGQLDAVMATKEVNQSRDVQLLLIGSTSDQRYYEQLQQYVDNHQLHQNVTFLGQVANPANYLSQADAVLICSRAEAFGRFTVEAMLQSKPVIGARAASTQELLGDFKKELLYTPGDTDQLANKITTLVDNSSLRKKIGQALKASASKKFSPNSANKPLLDHLDSISQTKKPVVEYHPLEQLLDKQSNQTVAKRLRMAVNAVRSRIVG